jgi:hypothetical protein
MKGGLYGKFIVKSENLDKDFIATEKGKSPTKRLAALA